MERDQFIKVLDQCWHDFRRQVIAAYPEQVASLRTAPAGRELQVGSSAVRAREDDRSLGPAVSNQSSLRPPENDNSAIDSEIVVASTASPLLRSALKDMQPSEALATSRHLRIRLGVSPHQQLVSGKSLHDALVALGLTRYDIEDMNKLVNALASYIGLYFEDASPRRIKFQEEADYLDTLQPVWNWPPKEASASPCHSGALRNNV